jgi:alpha-amylase
MKNKNSRTEVTSRESRVMKAQDSKPMTRDSIVRQASQQSGPTVCFYFQVHQPYRLKDLRVTDIGAKGFTPFDEEKNRAIFRKVAEKCYLPANRTMLEMLKADKSFRVSYSLSGVFLDQCEQWGEDVLQSFRDLAKTGRVEFLAETYYHSLSALHSAGEFCEQVGMHVRAIKRLFGVTPAVFRNTELIFNNEIAQTVRLMGFKGILTEGVDRLLHGRAPNRPYVPPAFRMPASKEKLIAAHRPLPKRSQDIHVLLKNYRLSDDVAFRFSDRNWTSFPLYSNTFAQWVKDTGGHSINLFMDYETFGEHQWADTGIFDFLRSLPDAFAKHGIVTATPSEVIDSWKKRTEQKTDVYDVHQTISWADSERDLSAWLGNHIQQSAMDAIYALEKLVKATNDKGLVEQWRKLTTSDHFYYMCTKYWADGDVHKYFSPYESPYEAYRRFSHALCDLRERATAKTPSRKVQTPKKSQKKISKS